MSEPPQINASLTAILQPGLSEDYDRPAGSNPPLWEGKSGCYVREEIRTTFVGTDLNRVLETSVYMDPDLVPVKSGYSLTYKYKDSISTRRVQSLVLRTLPGVPNYLVALLEISNAP